MPTPIVVQPRRNKFGQLLGALLLQKVAHNQRLEEQKLEIEAEKAQQGALKREEYEKEGRTPGPYKEGVTNPYTGNRWSGIPKPEDIAGFTIVKEGGKWKYKTTPNVEKYKEGQLEDFKVGNKLVRRKYTKGKWVDTGETAPRYKPTTNIYNQMSIGERERAKDLAFIKGPKFRAVVEKDVKNLFGNEKWNYDLSDMEKQNAIRKEAGTRIRIMFPDANIKFGEDNGTIGWFKINPDGSTELLAPWAE